MYYTKNILHSQRNYSRRLLVALQNQNDCHQLFIDNILASSSPSLSPIFYTHKQNPLTCIVWVLPLLVTPYANTVPAQKNILTVLAQEENFVYEIPSMMDALHQISNKMYVLTINAMHGTINYMSCCHIIYMSCCCCRSKHSICSLKFSCKYFMLRARWQHLR